ncbi:hypothetical protein Tco_1487398, partial [Tanacetum coccineum]
MTTLKFVDTHNMVSFLSKPAKSEGFEQIVDFLNANPINYALTVNPTIYASCIKQFRATAKAKTVNGEVQLQALVDEKKIIITESTVKRDLQLKDAEDEAVNKEMDDSLVRATTTASSLEAEQDNGNINKTQSKATPNEPSSSGGPRRQDTMGDTSAQTRVLDLENTKTAQAQEITSLKVRVKKLEKKGGSRTYTLKRLYKVGRSARMVFSNEASLGDQEDASKQGRKIDDIDTNEDIYLVNVPRDEDMFVVNDLEGDEVVVETEFASKDVNLSIDEVTLAQALAALKSAKPK